MSNYLPTVFGENLMDVFDDFDRTFFRGFNRPEHVLYGKNAAHMMKTDVKRMVYDFTVFTFLTYKYKRLKLKDI